MAGLDDFLKSQIATTPLLHPPAIISKVLGL
jgi:hypothetical protein